MYRHARTLYINWTVNLRDELLQYFHLPHSPSCCHLHLLQKRSRGQEHPLPDLCHQAHRPRRLRPGRALSGRDGFSGSVSLGENAPSFAELACPRSSVMSSALQPTMRPILTENPLCFRSSGRRRRSTRAHLGQTKRTATLVRFLMTLPSARACFGTSRRLRGRPLGLDLVRGVKSTRMTDWVNIRELSQHIRGHLRGI